MSLHLNVVNSHKNKSNRRKNNKLKSDDQTRMKTCLPRRLYHYIQEQGLGAPLLVWILWLLIGTIFYGHVDFNKNYYKGFYYSVNVGYSIGWGVLGEFNQGSYVFSIAYLLVGATLISGSLVYLIESIVSTNEMWFQKINTSDINKNSSDYKVDIITENSYFKKVKTYISNNTYQTTMIVIWLIWILFGTIWSCYVIEWTIIEGIYFSLSSLSTGGLHGIPYDSANWVFLITGLYACTGVPIMAMAMGSIASMVVAMNKEKKINSMLNKRITKKEISKINFFIYKILSSRQFPLVLSSYLSFIVKKNSRIFSKKVFHNNFRCALLPDCPLCDTSIPTRREKVTSDM